ncbi:MAG: hypothetical protein WC707_02400 [Candidatus Babeliaceae bacterium]|jgi:hypothetical protein
MNRFNSDFLKDIDLKKYKVTYDDFYIDPIRSFEQQKWSFKEDILQLEFDDYTIDVGWYPEFNPNGYFKIRVIKDYDWDNPLYNKKTHSLKTMKKYLQEAIDFTNNITMA